MLLTSVIFFLTSTVSHANALTCPYQSLASDAWRQVVLGFHNEHRKMLAANGIPGVTAKAKQMNEMVWNCETEYNLNKMQLELTDNDIAVYRNFGVNNITAGATSGRESCYYVRMIDMITEWVVGEYRFPPNAEYNGDTSLLPAANMLQWNSTEMACAYRSFDSGDLVRLVCAYNARADDGQPIFEGGNGICPEGTQCGDNGTCVVDGLCRVPNSNPDVLLPIYTPSLQCPSSSLMSQFSRYYAVNLHNYYRRLIASGWAESKLTVFAPRASGMSTLSYDCSLEKTAAENVEKCGNSFFQTNKNYVATGVNTASIRDISISQEAALEQAMSEWFSELQKSDVDPSSVWTDSSVTANITNIMRDKYETVGCAVNRCTTQGVTIVECRYSPKNLQTGDAIYDVGDPCSKCDNSEKCVFGVLCQK